MPHKRKLNSTRRIGSTARRRRKRKLIETFGLVCGICKTDIESTQLATLDHIIPASRGGKHSLDNLQLAHHACNNKKSNTIDAAMLSNPVDIASKCDIVIVTNDDEVRYDMLHVG